jgi:hypothetical protein
MLCSVLVRWEVYRHWVRQNRADIRRVDRSQDLVSVTRSLTVLPADNACSVFNDPNTIAEEDVRILSVCFTPDGKYLAIGGGYGLMQVRALTSTCLLATGIEF